MPSLALGIIGCGRAATALHLPALAKIPQVRAVAVCDTNAAALEDARSKFGIESAYADYRELIADPRVEAVAICTPAPLHADAAVAALEAGKPTFIEKPLALRLEDCDRMLAAAGRGGALAAVGHNLRCHRLVERAREVIAEGALGRVQMLRTVWTAGFNLGREMPAWREKRDLGGGALIELGVHHFDLWRFLTGQEVAECSAVSLSETSDDQAAAAQAQLTGGAVCSTALSQRTADSNEIEVYGDRGRLRFSIYQADSFVMYSTADLGGGVGTRLKEARQRAAQLPGLLRSMRIGGPYIETYQREWLRFAQAVAQGADPPCSLADGREAVRTLDRLRRSLTVGAAS